MLANMSQYFLFQLMVDKALFVRDSYSILLPRSPVLLLQVPLGTFRDTLLKSRPERLDSILHVNASLFQRLGAK